MSSNGGVKVVFIVFAISGFAILIGGLFDFYKANTRLTYPTAQGEVLRLESHRSSEKRDSTTYYAPVIEFMPADGQPIVFTSSVSSSPPSYSRGERVEVLYNPKNPSDASIRDFSSLWLFPVVFSSMGFIFLLVGFAPFIISIHLKKKKEFLKQNGICVQAEIVNVELNGSIRFNGKSPFRIKAQWMDPLTSTTHLFMSENLWFDLTNFDSMNNINLINVWMERDNPRKYYVDVSFLPKLMG